MLCGVLSALFWLWLLKLSLTARHGQESVSAPADGNAANDKSPAELRKGTGARRRKAKARSGKAVSAPAKHRRIGLEKILLGVEVGAIVLLVVVGLSLWQTQRDVNRVYRNLQKTDPRILPTLMAAANPGVAVRQQAANTAFAAPALPTPYPTVTPVAALATVPESSGSAQPELKVEAETDVERSDLDNEGPTVETASTIAFGMSSIMVKRAPESGQPRRLQIPAIGVDSFIYQDYGEEWLKLGVVQVGQPVAAGARGNLVLAGHNDVYGEVFRDLDELEAGHDIFVLGDSTKYKYRVRETLIVDPDEIWVTMPTSTATLTLVSCYPYLADTHRIVVFAELVP